MLTNVSDRCLLGWLGDAPRGHRKVGRDDVFRRVAQRAVRALSLSSTYVGPIATSLATMWGRGELEITDGILQVSPSMSKRRAIKPERRPAALARRQELGIGPDPIYLCSDGGPSSPTCVGGAEDPRVGERWRLVLAGIWLEMATPEQVIQVMHPGHRPELSSYGYPQELAHLEEVNGCGGLTYAAPGCI